MATKTIETRTSICAVCDEPISTSVIVGEQKWHDVSWLHDRDPQAHDAVPELRVAVDATCPGCDYPEIGYAPQRAEFACSRCGHTTTERPKD